MLVQGEDYAAISTLQYKALASSAGLREGSENRDRGADLISRRLPGARRLNNLATCSGSHSLSGGNLSNTFLPPST